MVESLAAQEKKRVTEAEALGRPPAPLTEFHTGAGTVRQKSSSKLVVVYGLGRRVPRLQYTGTLINENGRMDQ